ncbi:MAG: hypothetical protein A2X36_07945 [Elusimicrobia bacterium GWA2_69_24]|nr:MAG: hypothetical protein A2X36_07945 [Elusimicrobia bacterium GWA2_69_24]HBH03716.1 hypothetical protein [Candidatus Rokubacteria bacterium]
MATPHVTGVAALLKAQDPDRDWRAIKNLILAGGDAIAALATTTITQKRLNARGALTCSNSTVLSRLLPVATTISGSVGTPIDLAALHINCADPNGNVSVTVNPGGAVISLVDDGLDSDQASGDGIYSGRWTPTAGGTFTLTFPGGDVVTVQALANYSVVSTPFSYRNITGTNLNLGDDTSASITSPFPILFGGGSFTTLFVSDNGYVNFTGSFNDFINRPMPTSLATTLVAPWWDDLFPVVGTSQNVFWEVTGSAPNRELVIEWRDIRYFICQLDSAATTKFQVVFFEGSSSILFNYADVFFGGVCTFADRGGSATVGVQVGPSLGTEFSLNSLSLNNNTALLWTVTAAPTAPTLNVTPTSRAFGKVPVGSSEDRTFTVKNIGGGTLTGSATTSAPFSVVSGGSYALTAGQSQQVTIRFTPTSAGTFAGSVSLSGAGGTSRSLTGTGISVSPIAPSGLTATPVSASQINLAWQDTNGNETETRIERKTGAGGTFAQIATVGANVTSFSDTGLTSNTTYVYRVRACNAVGCSNFSNEASASTQAVFTLTVTVRGSASGTVTSSPAGIDCGTDCSEVYTSGTSVTLTAAPGAGVTFKQWSGACAGTALTCQVSMTQARAVTATFAVVFTDAGAGDALPAGTLIKAVHFTELLGAINKLRAVLAMSAATWGITPTAGGTVLASQLTTLREALAAIPGATGFTTTPMAAGTLITRAQLNELRAAVRPLE